GRVYMAAVKKQGLPWEYWRWELVKETGWTLEYVDALSVADMNEWLQVRDGMSKARKTLVK
ncbi:MAG: hypothetical protein PHT43_04740, partial [Anaerolineaceae bacterium]|nr:hypothetical protein [Anaerolineaceae bacterium]